MDIKLRVIGKDLFQRLSTQMKMDEAAFPTMFWDTPINWQLSEGSADCRPEDLLCFPEKPCVLVVEAHDTAVIEKIQLMEQRLHAFIKKNPDMQVVLCPIIMAFQSPTILVDTGDFPDIVSDWMFSPIAISDLALRVFGALKRKGVLKTGRSVGSHNPGILSERETQILRLANGGMKNSILAMKLFLSETTVKWHLQKIYTKFNVNNRTGAIARARELGLL